MNYNIYDHSEPPYSDEEFAIDVLVGRALYDAEQMAQLLGDEWESLTTKEQVGRLRVVFRKQRAANKADAEAERGHRRQEERDGY